MSGEALLTNQVIHKSRPTLEVRHYPLISAYKRDEHRFHVAVQPSRLNGTRSRGTIYEHM
jgi:hypothetical protein